MHARHISSYSKLNSRPHIRTPTLLPYSSTRCLLCLPSRHVHEAYPDTHTQWQRKQLLERNVYICSATASEVSSSGSQPHTEWITDQPPPVLEPAPVASAVDAIFTSLAGARWRIQPYDNSDYAVIIKLQTDSFHTANPVPFLNTLTYNNFRAEVVDALRQKTKYSDPSSFQLLVARELPAEATANACSCDADDLATGADNASRGTSANSNSIIDRNSSVNGSILSSLQADAFESQHASCASSSLVGCIEVSLMEEWEVLRALRRTAGAAATIDYAYISSMCVSSIKRRRGVAQALMAAAEAQALRWQQPRLALHVYKDNVPAVELYRRCGMQIIDEDPGWKAMLGGRVRLLMYKELTLDTEARTSGTAGQYC